MLEEHGWRGKVVAIDRLTDLEEAVRGSYEHGMLDETLYREQLSWFSFDPPQDLRSPRSIIVVAVPTPQMKVYFHWQGKRLPVVIPPTYVSYTSRTERVQAVLAGWLERQGYGMAKPRLPLKTLAVRSGLAEYGLNNICYVRGMGSSLQLVGAFSDLPCAEDSWRKPRALDRCNTCVACLQRCPTGAITSDRFLLRAERCLTYHNEGESDFADWIDPAWHHCLIGCMRCQSICPENREVKEWFEDRCEFSEQETAALVDRMPFAELPAETVIKLESLEINEDYLLLCRNLSAAKHHLIMRL
jgi:epoxyqueuosine reductase